MKQLKLKQQQQGALIVLTLIILLIVSMLGMSTMDTTGIEMRMASNTRDQQQAFEAAEYTLSWVQNNIGGGTVTNAQLSNFTCGAICFENTCSNGYCFDGSDPLDWANCQLDSPATEPYESAALWADASGFHQTLLVPNSGITTKYIVEFRCYTALDAEQAMSVTNFTRLFRITAFATGTGGRSRVMLRSTFKDS